VEINIRLPNEWTPRPYQADLWRSLMHCDAKRTVMLWHRRSGKDDVALNYTVIQAVTRVGNYWYMLPKYEQARKSMWSAINPNTGKLRLDGIIPYELRKSTIQDQMKIELINGSTIQLVGSDTFNALVGSPPIGLVFSEFALCDPSAWAYLMPIVEENNGWVIFNGTPRGKNHFHRLAIMAENNPDWNYSRMTADETGVFFESQLEKIKAELIAQYGEEFGTALYLQEYYVSFEAAIMGAIWADCIYKLQYSGKIGEYPWIPKYPVHCAFDLGLKDTTAIWFYQVIASEIRVIDCHESGFKDIPFYVDLLRGKPYKYGSIWLPHDGFAKTLLGGGKSIDDQFRYANKDGRFGKIRRVPSTTKMQGIQAARATFPRVVFNADSTADGVEALINYHTKYDEKKKVFSNEPDHDESSNYADAWRYLSLSWKEAKAIEDGRSHDDALLTHSVQNIPMKNIMAEHLKRMKKLNGKR